LRLARTISAPRACSFFRLPAGKTPADSRVLIDASEIEQAALFVRERLGAHSVPRLARFRDPTTRIGIPFGFAGGRASVAHIMPARIEIIRARHSREPFNQNEERKKHEEGREEREREREKWI